MRTCSFCVMAAFAVRIAASGDTTGTGWGGGRMKDVLGVTLRLCAKGACVPCLLSEGEGGLRVLLLSAP